MQLYLIGVLAQKSGVSVKAIRYYSDIGLLAPAQTTDAGYRLYGDREELRLEQIAILRFLGASIQEVRRLLDDEMSLLEFLTNRSETVDAEIKRLGRLQQVISQAREGITRHEDPWLYLKNLERVVDMNEKERGQWWEQRWRRVFGDSSLPAEFIDGFITDVLESRKLLNSEKEADYILAVENGEQDKFQREMYEEMARHRGMDVDQTQAKMRELAEGLRLAIETDPGQPVMQDTVDDYVSFLAGSSTEADLKRALASISQPIIWRMFAAHDLIKGDDRGQTIYHMIVNNLRLRLDQSRSDIDPNKV